MTGTRKDQLRQKIVEMLLREYADLTEPQLGEIFSLVLGDLRARGSTGLSPSSMGFRTTPPSLQPPMRITQSRPTEGHRVVIEIFGTKDLAGIRTQIQASSAIFVKLDDELPLNSEVDVCLAIPATQAEIWFEGRAVARSAAGTALDLKPARPDFFRPLDEAGAAFAAGQTVEPAATFSLKTQPPRVMRRTGVKTQPPKAEVSTPDPESSGFTMPSRRVDLSKSGPRTEAAVTPPSRPITRTRAEQLGSVTPQPASFGGPLTLEEVRQATKQVQPDIQGVMPKHAMASLLVEVANQHSDGIIRIELGRKTFFVIVQIGCPVEILVDPADEALDLGTLLVEAGKVTKAQHTKAATMAETQGLEYGEALVRLRILSYQKLLAALQSRVVLILTRLLRRGEGTFTHHPLESLPFRYNTPPVSLARIAFRTVYKRTMAMSPEELDAQVGGRIDHFPSRVQPPPCDIDDLKLPQKERRFYDVILDNDKQLRFIIGISNLNESHTLALVLTMETLGILEIKKRDIAVTQRHRHIEKIQAHLKVLSNASHFEALDIHWSSYTEKVMEGYQTQKQLFAPNTFPEAIRDELQPELEKIYAILDAAKDALLDTQARRAYRAGMINSMQMENGIGLYLRKGDMAMLRMDALEARTCYKRVLEMEPRHVQARSKLKALKRK